ncbi:hypothetical protein V5O48_009229 [Marasmius crinis-equi]|uniref:Uncharacterized protein n=1 Tax=Marasmius crinis-equi TaxID=585013 RepID=A0ABR3FBU6_9AGAR
MGYSEAELKGWSNEKLIVKEVSHRRSIAGFITSLTLTSVGTAASGGSLAVLSLPLGAFEAYKIKSHKSKLDMVRKELARRHLSPLEKRKRDVLIPVAVTSLLWWVLGDLANAIDAVPVDVQLDLNSEIEGLAEVQPGSGGLDKVGDDYQTAVLTGLAAPLGNAAMNSGLRAKRAPKKQEQFQPEPLKINANTVLA